MKLAIATSFIGLLVIVRGAPAPKSQPYTTWSAFGGTPDSLQYSALTQINKAKVNQIEQVWFYPVIGRAELAFSPLVVGGMMYVAGKGNRMVIALDAATGKEIWTHTTEGTVNERGFACWQSRHQSARVFFS